MVKLRVDRTIRLGYASGRESNIEVVVKMYVHIRRFVYSWATVMVGLAMMVFVPGCKTGSTGVGAERGACYPNGTCNAGLVCMSDLCVKNVVPGVENVVPAVKNVVTGGMVLIPAGSFWMGCNATVDSQCEGDESPYHEVTLSGYYIDKTEVTQGEYKKCIDAGECDTPSCNWDPTGKPNRPVVCVNWTQAGEYCAWAGKRLPTEAEWEKAARGTDGRKYPYGNETVTCDYAVMHEGSDGCGKGGTIDVCSKSPAGDSPYGLCDMSGNVYEWVSDWYDPGYYTNSPASNPTGPVSGSGRVLRGGSFYSHGVYLRASYRSADNPSYADYYLGFRCARSQ